MSPQTHWYHLDPMEAESSADGTLGRNIYAIMTHCERNNIDFDIMPCEYGDECLGDPSRAEDWNRFSTIPDGAVIVAEKRPHECKHCGKSTLRAYCEVCRVRTVESVEDDCVEGFCTICEK